MKQYFIDLFDYLTSRITVSIWAFFCLTISISGPFDTYRAMGMPERALYWTSVITFATILASCVKLLTSRLCHKAGNLAVSVITAFVFTAIYAPIFWMYSVGFSDGRIKQDFDFPVIAGLIGSTALVLLVLRHVLGFDDAPNTETDASSETETPTIPRLAERLENIGSNQIYRLSVSDHFVDVYYGTGSHERLRMRLSDAVREMDTVDGFSIHRSHWVAKAALKSVYRDGGRIWAVLNDGSELPVGRTFKDNVAYLIAD